MTTTLKLVDGAAAGLPPFVTAAEQDAEAALAGMAVGWPDRVLSVALPPEAFGDLRWAAVWRAGRDLRNAGRPVDALTMVDHFEATGVRSLGIAELSALLLRVPTADNAEHYAAIVRDGWIRRQAGFVAQQIHAAALRCEEGAEVLSEAMRLLSAIDAEGPRGSITVHELTRERCRQIRDIATAKERGDVAATGIPTGLPSLDRMLGGLQRGIVTVGAGRPGMGKSSFGLAVARHASALGVGVHVFSLEDTRDAYGDRVLSGESRVPAERLRQVELQAGDLPRIAGAVDALSAKRPWLIEDRAGITAEEIVRSMRAERERNGTELVIVDYVQLLKYPARLSREEGITHAMGVLADAAKQERIALLLLAQLNRECEKRDDKRPILSDLKAAGAIEERAKCVVMLYRPVVYDEHAPADLVELIVRKNNQGQVGTATALWDGPTIRMHGGSW